MSEKPQARPVTAAELTNLTGGLIAGDGGCVRPPHHCPPCPPKPPKWHWPRFPVLVK
jgi:hypothetical protein